MVFLRFILLVCIIFYLIRIIIRLLAPILIQRFANKMHDRFQQFNQHPQNQKESFHKEGEVTIEKNNNTRKDSDGLGEYIDFEEVDEQ